MNKIEKDSYANLLANIAAGDAKAFSELYNIFYPSLLQHAISKVYEKSAAEDILHDLFLNIWNIRERIQEIQSLPAYLYTSCRHLIFAYLKKSAQAGLHENLEDLNIEYKEESLEDRLYYRYLLDIANQEIENLPEKCRQVFKLSREEFKTNQEIAAYLQISESTVENHINKALKRIRGATKHFVFFCYSFTFLP